MWLVGLCRQECRCRAVVNVKTMYRLAVSCLVLASSFTPSHLLPVFFRYTAWGRDHQQSSCVFFARCNRSSCALSFTISNLFYWRLHSHHHASYRKRRSLHTNDSRPCGSHTYRNFSCRYSFIAWSINTRSHVWPRRLLVVHIPTQLHSRPNHLIPHPPRPASGLTSIP
jgi:hypothetical protein